MDALLQKDAVNSEDTPWRAFLSLELEVRGGKSCVAHVEHQGPLRIQRAFYPEGAAAAHIYLLHPPGGVAGGDQLRLEAELGPGSRCLLTAPAANKLYRTRGPEGEVTQVLTVREGAFLEWFPQETIAFSGSRCRLSTVVHLEPGAHFFGWEITCLGRPAAGETFDRGRLDQRFEIWQGDMPRYLDRLVLGDGSDAQRAVWGLDGECVVGSLLIATEMAELSELIRMVLESDASFLECAACSQIEGVMTVRYVGPSARSCWKLFLEIWRVLRPLVFGVPAVPPRIWSY